jgi:DNA-binding LytR/AlgR family response regulator
MKILIIEDELPAAKQLIRLIEQQKTPFQILATLDSVEASIAWLQKNEQPDLIFMDIQLADGLSFDIFQQIEIKSPVVFTTAFDQYAVKAFRVSAFDYLLKPIDPDDFKIVFDKIIAKNATELPQKSDLLRFFQKEPYKERFLIKSSNGFSFLQTPEIAWFDSSESLTQAHLHTGKKMLLDHTLDELEQLLNPNDFYRTSRKMIVSVKSIAKIHLHFNGRLKVELLPSCAEDGYVSRERVSGFKSWLGG